MTFLYLKGKTFLFLIVFIPGSFAYLLMFFWGWISTQVLNVVYILIVPRRSIWYALNILKRPLVKTRKEEKEEEGEERGCEKRKKKLKKKTIVSKTPTLLWVAQGLCCNSGATLDIIFQKKRGECYRAN